MSSASSADTLDRWAASDYKWGFVTDIETDTVPPGLNEDVIRLISAKKKEPAWLTEWRLEAYRGWQKMTELGLTGIPFPEDLGGSDGGTLAYIIAVEEISKVCASTGLTLAAHVSLGTYPIYQWGSTA